MRLRPSPLSILFSCCALVYPSSAPAERIRALVPDEPWEVSIEIDGFEPWDVLQPKTILGGSTTNGLIITIIVEEEKPPLAPSQVLAKYWRYGEPGQQQIEYTNRDLLIVSSKNIQPAIGRAFNGYAVKDDRSFDIHVSAVPSTVSREQVIKTLRSLQIGSSSEGEAIERLERQIRATRERLKRKELYLAFTEKYPRNAWGFARLAEAYYGLEERALAEKAYLRALENHRTQPMINPYNLWLCYDGLGLVAGLSRRYASARSYFEKGYRCAKDMEDDARLADSAYNLACVYAETGDLEPCLKYLREAVKLAPPKKDDAKTDSSFAGIRTRAEFKDLISR